MTNESILHLRRGGKGELMGALKINVSNAIEDQDFIKKNYSITDFAKKVRKEQLEHLKKSSEKKDWHFVEYMDSEIIPISKTNGTEFSSENIFEDHSFALKYDSVFSSISMTISRSYYSKDYLISND